MKYPIGIQNFERIRREGYAYVDKTAIVWKLVNDGSYYFLSRPRRFGKSLLLSTIEAYMEGKRELFEGLAIAGLEREWKRYPILHLDLNAKQYNDKSDLLKILNMHLERWEGIYGDKYKDRDPEERFMHVIEQAYEKTGMPVVILVDEYDKPMLHKLGTPEVRPFRDALKRFYSVIKTCEGLQRFALVTGISKFSKVSIFSDLNNLTDVTMMPRYATLLGYTRAEVEANFSEHVAELGRGLGLSPEEAMARIVHWYDGYRFAPRSEARVCNPVSLGNAFKFGELKGYWEMTGRATLVINRIKKSGKLPEDLENVPADAFMLDVCDAESLPMEALLYQGGYLTIKDVKRGDPKKDETDKYVLAPPNFEVRAALKRGYLAQVMGLDEDPFNTLVDRAKRQIASGDIADVVETMLFSLYAQIPPDWRIKDEAEAKRYFQLFFAMLGSNPAPEFPSARGYADAVVERPSAVYVFEFKYDESSEAAIRQIRERGYADKWIGGARPVTLVGINFNPKKRNIDIPVIEQA